MSTNKNSQQFDKTINKNDAAESRRTIFDFLSQVMIVFAFAVLVLNVFALIFGEGVKEISSMFSLGGQGISANVIFEFFAASLLIVAIKFLFLSDIVFKKMKDWLRILCMLTLIFAVIVVFVALFHWFPTDQTKAWILFLVCYVVSFLGSTIVSTLKMKTENKKLEEALQRLKNQEM